MKFVRGKKKNWCEHGRLKLKRQEKAACETWGQVVVRSKKKRKKGARDKRSPISTKKPNEEEGRRGRPKKRFWILKIRSRCQSPPFHSTSTIRDLKKHQISSNGTTEKPSRKKTLVAGGMKRHSFQGEESQIQGKYHTKSIKPKRDGRTGEILLVWGC